MQPLTLKEQIKESEEAYARRSMERLKEANEKLTGTIWVVVFSSRDTEAERSMHYYRTPYRQKYERRQHLLKVLIATCFVLALGLGIELYKAIHG